MSSHDETMLYRWAIEPAQFFGALPELTFDMIALLKEPPEPKPLQGKPRCNIVLRTLPYDIVFMIFDLLNFKDLAYLLQTCRDAKQLVEWYPAFRLVREHAPKVLVALCIGGLLRFHPATRIYRVLRKNRCKYCGAYGPLLFLVAAVRCCLPCLDSKTAFRLFPVSMLPPSMTRDGIAVLHVPVCGPTSALSCRNSGNGGGLKMAAVEQAKETLIARGLEQRCDLPFILRSRGETPVSNLDLNSPSGPAVLFDLQDAACGAMSIPSVCSGNVVESCLWCYGCRLRHLQYQKEPKPNQDRFVERLLLHDRYHARTKEELLQHIKECKGVKGLQEYPCRITALEILTGWVVPMSKQKPSF